MDFEYLCITHKKGNLFELLWVVFPTDGIKDFWRITFVCFIVWLNVRTLGKAKAMPFKETAAISHGLEEVWPWLCHVHFLSWRAQYCSQPEQNSQADLVGGGLGLSVARRVADLQSLGQLLHVAHHDVYRGSVRGKDRLPGCDVL